MYFIIFQFILSYFKQSQGWWNISLLLLVPRSNHSKIKSRTLKHIVNTQYMYALRNNVSFCYNIVHFHWIVQLLTCYVCTSCAHFPLKVVNFGLFLLSWQVVQWILIRSFFLLATSLV